jgi:hypothetical protein
MSDLFDKIFVDRVNDVFTNHQESYRPGDWKKLQSKMNRSKRGIIILWPHIAKAASVALFLGVAVFTVNKYENKSVVSNFNEERLNEYHQTNDNTTLNETTTTQNFAKKDNTVLVDKSNTHENESSVNMSEEKNKSETLIAVNENDYDKYKDIGNERFVDVKLDLQRHHNEIAQMDKKQSIANDLKLIEYEEFVVENEEKNKKN